MCQMNTAGMQMLQWLPPTMPEPVKRLPVSLHPVTPQRPTEKKVRPAMHHVPQLTGSLGVSPLGHCETTPADCSFQIWSCLGPGRTLRNACNLGVTLNGHSVPVFTEVFLPQRFGTGDAQHIVCP